MSCPTCDHTMQRVAANPFHTAVWWCPRCGTLCDAGPGGVPRLVDRCRKLGEAIDDPNLSAMEVKDAWHKANIADCINPTGDRPA